MPLGGLLLAIFVGWFLQKKVVQEQLQLKHRVLFRLWWFAIRFIVPALIVFVKALDF